MTLKRICILMSSAALLSLSMSSQANIRVLDFETFVGPSPFDNKQNSDTSIQTRNVEHGQIIDDEYLNDYGVLISSCNFLDGVNDSGNGPCVFPDRADFQVAFDTSETYTEDRDLEFFKDGDGNFVNRDNSYVPDDQLYRSLSQDFNEYDPSKNIDSALQNASVYGGPGNVLIIQENTDYCDLQPNGFDSVCNRPDDEGSRAAGYIDFSFDDLVTILSLDFFDVEDKQQDSPRASDIQFFTLVNRGGELVEELIGTTVNSDGSSVYQAPDLVNGGFARTFFGLDGIAEVSRLRINLPGSGAIDNLVFHTGETTDVPAPSTFGLFAIVFAGLFYNRRKA